MSMRRFAAFTPALTLATLLGIMVPRAASATQGAELYRTQAHFYGREKVRVKDKDNLFRRADGREEFGPRFPSDRLLS